MSLGKLLATGRSLVGGAPDAGRYNISERNRLPKFGSAKNPFAAPAVVVAPTAMPAPVECAEPAPIEVPLVKAATPFSAIESPVSAPVAAITTITVPQPKLGERLQAAFAVVRSGAERAVAVAWPLLKSLAARVAGWAGRLLGWFRRSEPNSFIPRFGKPAVQTELSLDSVKVLRSDLVESDLEVVVADTATGTQAGPKVPVATPNRGPVPPALKKLTDRILGPQLH